MNFTGITKSSLKGPPITVFQHRNHRKKMNGIKKYKIYIAELHQHGRKGRSLNKGIKRPGTG